MTDGVNQVSFDWTLTLVNPCLTTTINALTIADITTTALQTSTVNSPSITATDTASTTYGN